jgi:membrane protein DedA with SNARE-associated domain
MQPKRFFIAAGIIAAFATLCAAAQVDPESLIGGGSIDGMGRVALFAAVALATFVSEDLACIAAGILAAKGRMSPIDAVAASYVGIFVGDMLIFLAGKVLGTAALPHRPLRWILKPAAVETAKLRFEKSGASIVFISRFVPGSRAATSFSAGALKQKTGSFTLIFAFAAAVWTPIIVILSMHMGRGIITLYGTYAKWALPCLLGAAVILFVTLRLAIPMATWRGRRLLLCRWRRFTHWEYWPLWAASGPVLLYVMYLGFIRMRRPTFFTVVNPGIKPDSGFIGESKDKIYKALSSAGDVILPWVKIDAKLPLEKRMDAVRKFMTDNALAYPIVLKSDEGQRSLGVKVIRSQADAQNYLSRAPGAMLAQKYADGAEFGVFYVRMPDDEHGRIISIVEKRLTYVTGDGRSTLERLILCDPRAVCMAPVFLTRFADHLTSVPAKGERIALVDIGTHAQGALFIDGAKYNTPRLLAEIERISKCFEGFYLGRYDLRAPSADDLMAGKNLQIIELNGVTGQCSHVYSPGNSVLYAWKTIMAQWDIAYNIARQNMARGIRPMSTREFLNHWRAAAKRQNRVRENLM